MDLDMVLKILGIIALILYIFAGVRGFTSR